MQLSRTARHILIAGTSLSLLAACGQKDREANQSQNEAREKSAAKNEAPEQAKTETKTETGEGGKSDSGTKADLNAENKDNSSQSANSAADGTAATGTGKESSPVATANSNGNVKINLNELPADTPICTVANTEIKVSDYKRMLQIEQSQANQAIVTDPGAKLRLLAEAKKRGINLSQEEKTKLLEAAHEQKGMDAAQFKEFLKKTHSTEAQFDNEVVLSGLAFKTSNAIIEESLLNELVNRALLAQAAKESGGEKEAMNKYLSFKQTPQYNQLLKQTGLSADSLKEEMLRAHLAKMQIAKLESKAKVSPEEVKKVYEQHKAQLKHGERIKLSTILVICPENDVGPIASVRTQLKKANPNLSDKELDTQSTQYIEQAKQKALILLGQAKAGADFAKLANENSNDPVTVAKKNGGDMGFVEKKDIIPTLAEPVSKLKSGELLPQLVKSELGYNIYKVTGKEPAGPFKFEEVRPTLELLAKQAKMQQVLAQWIADRRKVVKVEFTPKFLAIANEAKAGASKITQ